MATSKETVIHLEDAVRDQRLVVKPMFGEFAIYFDGAVVGLICDDRVFIKITEGTRAHFGSTHPTALPYPKAKPQFILQDDDLDDGERLKAILSTARRDVGITPKPRKAK
jgi:TfoX/Sxy family transcriptional regulator of competence genes